MVRQCLGDGISPGGCEPGDGIAQLAQAAREVQGDNALIFDDEDAGGGVIRISCPAQSRAYGEGAGPARGRAGIDPTTITPIAVKYRFP